MRIPTPSVTVRLMASVAVASSALLMSSMSPVRAQSTVSGQENNTQEAQPTTPTPDEAPFAVEGESEVGHVGDSDGAVLGTYGVSDGAGTVTWSLTGDDSEKFEIGSTGELSFVELPDVENPGDQDSDNVYDVTVNATSSDYINSDEIGTSFTATKNVAVTVVFAVKDVWFRTDRPSGSYGKGDRIEVGVQYLAEVSVTGVPQISLDVGGEERVAQYSEKIDGAPEEGTVLSFGYVVRTGDSDTDGPSIEANSLRLNGGSIVDSHGHPVSLDHDAQFATWINPVSAPVASISQIFLDDPFHGGSTPGSSQAAYSNGDSIVVFVEFSEAVSVTSYVDPATEVTHWPSLALTIGEATRDAAYDPTYSHADGRTLRFVYSVVVGDMDDNGLSVAANSLDLNGAAIVDSTGAAASVIHDAVAADPQYTVSAPGGL